MRFAPWFWLALLAAGPAIAEEVQVLPRQVLFDPLLADPRWPHFSAAVQEYGEDSGLGRVGAISVGNAIGFYRAPALGGDWSIGLQAAVFAVFDLEAQSKDLINADYVVGIPLAWRRGDWSALVRVYHQSSHLGDEFLLRSQNNRGSRINLSYEAVDARLSRHFWNRALRIYGGAGMLFDQEPEDLKSGMVQGGLEMRGPCTLVNGLVQPIAALDLQALEETGWNLDVSARLGVELTSTVDRDYTLQLTLEYYKGRNPNGQFYTREVEFYGVGLHAYF